MVFILCFGIRSVWERVRNVGFSVVLVILGSGLVIWMVISFSGDLGEGYWVGVREDVRGN